jgi:hypothetical protein
VEQVLGDVPPEKRCKCNEQPKTDSDRPKSVLRRLFG